MNDENRTDRTEEPASLVEILDAAASNAEHSPDRSGASIRVTELASDDPIATLLHQATSTEAEPGESS